MNRNVPVNHNKKWTKEQNELFIKLVKEKVEIDTIAENLKRTYGSIKSRLNILIYNWFTEGKTIEWIIQNTPYTSIEYVEEIIKTETKKKEVRQKKREEKKKNKKTTVDEILIGLSTDIDCEKRGRKKKKKGGYTESIQDIREDIKNIKIMMKEMMSILQELTIEE